jgi:hypothetical protein
LHEVSPPSGGATVTIARLMTLRALAIAAAAATSLSVTSAAQAADWTRITSASSGTRAGEVSLLRTADGTLHVAWLSATASYRHRLDHRPIAPDGSVGVRTTITEDWLEMSDPALTAGPDGLRVLFGGLHTAHPDEINTELNTAVSVDGGVTWGLQDGSILQPGTDATDAPVGAAAQADGAPLAAWASDRGTWTNRGLSPALGAANLQAPLGGSGTRPGVASIGARTVVAWYSDGAQRGVYAQEIAPDGTPAGAAMRMPGTQDTRSAMPGRTPVAARVGGKVFVVYATGSGSTRRIMLWSVGSSSARTIARASRGAVAAVAADGAGRLWVAWTTRSGARDEVMVRRSDARVRRFGDVVDAGRPPSGSVGRTLDISPAGGALDVLAGYSSRTSTRATTWYSRIGAGT